MIPDIINFLTKRRIHLGISQREICRKLSTSNSTVHAWENNTQTPELTSLIRWAEALGLTVTYKIHEERNFVQLEIIVEGEK